MIALDARKLSTANEHHVVHQRFKQPDTYIVLILIQPLMHLGKYLGRPLQCRTTNLLLRIYGVLIDTYPINLVINEIFDVLEHVAETWGNSAVLVPAVCIAIVFIAGTSTMIDGEA